MKKLFRSSVALMAVMVMVCFISMELKPMSVFASNLPNFYTGKEHSFTLGDYDTFVSYKDRYDNDSTFSETGLEFANGILSGTASEGMPEEEVRTLKYLSVGGNTLDCAIYFFKGPQTITDIPSQKKLFLTEQSFQFAPVIKNGNNDVIVSSNPDDQPIATYASSDESVATISTDGTVTPVMGGTTTITVSSPATKSYEAATSVTCTLIISTVSSVIVSPSTTSVQKGNTENFSAAVSGTGSPAQKVTWDVEGESSASTTINTSGLLTVGSDETTDSIVVKATSTADTTKSGTATVTVTDVPITYHTITTVASPTNGGTISGGGQVADGGSTTLTASHNSGYKFIKWTLNDNQASTSASYLISNITADATYIAVFKKKNDSSTNESSGEKQNSQSSSSITQTAYVNPLSWNYAKDNSNSLCLITKQGVLCQQAFQNATPAGYTEAFSFNLMLKGVDQLFKPAYDLKTGELVLYIPPEYQKTDRTFALLGIDKNGNTKKFTDSDTGGASITIADLGEFAGYAFSLIYTDKKIYY